MNERKRHHFIPEMLLKHFTDEKGRLWCWRRAEPAKFYQTVPRNAFAEGHLYTVHGPNGEKDYTLEEHWQKLEDATSPVLERILAAVRAGCFPHIRQQDWIICLKFYDALVRRNPNEIKQHVEALDLLASAERVCEACDAADGISPAFREKIPKATSLVRVAILNVQAEGPTPKIAEYLANCGLLFLCVADSRASLVMGDRPGATAFLPISGVIGTSAVRFLPVAADVALVLQPNAEGCIGVAPLSTANVRAMNEATTAYSQMIAGRSEKLIRCLSL